MISNSGSLSVSYFVRERVRFEPLVPELSSTLKFTKRAGKWMENKMKTRPFRYIEVMSLGICIHPRLRIATALQCVSSCIGACAFVCSLHTARFVAVLSPDRVSAIREAEFACTKGRWGSVSLFYLTHFSCKTDFWERFPTRFVPLRIFLLHVMSLLSHQRR